MAWATYRYIDLLDLDSLAEEDDPLAKVGELPHITNALEKGGLLRSIGTAGVDLVEGSLPCRRHLWQWAIQTRDVRRRRVCWQVETRSRIRMR